MLMSQVKHWSVKHAQKVPSASAEVCALITGINYPLDLTVASQMSIIQDMGMTVNILQKKMAPTVQSEFTIIDLQDSPVILNQKTLGISYWNLLLLILKEIN